MTYEEPMTQPRNLDRELAEARVEIKRMRKRIDAADRLAMAVDQIETDGAGIFVAWDAMKSYRETEDRE